MLIQDVRARVSCLQPVRTRAANTVITERVSGDKEGQVRRGRVGGGGGKQEASEWVQTGR